MSLNVTKNQGSQNGNEKKGYGDLVDKWEETLNKKNVKLCQNLDKNMSTFKITVHRLKVQARNNIFQVV